MGIKLGAMPRPPMSMSMGMGMGMDVMLVMSIARPMARGCETDMATGWSSAMGASREGRPLAAATVAAGFRSAAVTGNAPSRSGGVASGRAGAGAGGVGVAAGAGASGVVAVGVGAGAAEVKAAAPSMSMSAAAVCTGERGPSEGAWWGRAWSKGEG